MKKVYWSLDFHGILSLDIVNGGVPHKILLPLPTNDMPDAHIWELLTSFEARLVFLLIWRHATNLPFFPPRNSQQLRLTDGLRNLTLTDVLDWPYLSSLPWYFASVKEAGLHLSACSSPASHFAMQYTKQASLFFSPRQRNQIKSSHLSRGHFVGFANFFLLLLYPFSSLLLWVFHFLIAALVDW